MAEPDEVTMVVRVSGPGWRVDLAVAPPADAGRVREFDVAPLGARDGDGARQRVIATLRYTSAVNRAEGWRQWHVKVYRCASQGDAEALRHHLHRQATDIHRANIDLPGPPRTGIQPPWAVVPAHIARGDGERDTLDGGVQTRLSVGDARTELALPADEMAREVIDRFPAWFSEGMPTPELCLLAVSPWVQPIVWDAFRASPGTEQLTAFLGMAVGLDTLHAGGTFHCDIKPDNVCRYVTDAADHLLNAGQVPVSGYVLIDADAVTRVTPPPITLRTSELYEYAGVRSLRRHAVEAGFGIDAGVLRAQDRFGFALVVLTALAGRDWVIRVLLSPLDDGTADGLTAARRRADDRSAVVRALCLHWPDTATRRWAPLIDVLAEPFGPEIEDLDWSAAAWIRRLIAAEPLCVRSAASPSPTHPLPVGDTVRFRRVLERIRAEASAAPAPRPERVQHVYEALRRHAHAVAARHAATAALAWGGGIVVVALMLVISALGWEK